MSRKVILALAAVATLAAAGLASGVADAHGFGGGGGFAGRGGFGGHFAGMGRIGGARFGGVFRGPGFGRFRQPGFPGHPIRWGRWGHWDRWAHFHHHRWFWRDGRWVILDGDDASYAVTPAPVAAAPGPCTCLTKTYTPDGLVVFADVCTREAASARVDGTDAPPAPPAKSSELTPPADQQTGEPDVSQAPTTTNFAGKTFKDFLAANAQTQK